MNCTCEGDGPLQCPVLKRYMGRNAVHLCRTNPLWRENALPDGVKSVPKKPSGGAGTELHKLLSSIGLEEKPGCKCKQRAAEMNNKGTAWCRENIDTIVGWLREEKERQGLKIPLFDKAAWGAVWLAIHRAEAKSEQTQ